MTSYSLDVIQAAGRVGRLFADGIDRGDLEDLTLLEDNGLMTRGECTDTLGQDSLEVGETMWTFNADGEALVASILDTPKPVTQ